MRRAIEYLVGRGLLVRKRGIGTQVVQAKVTREVELTSLYDDLATTGRDPSSTVISFGTEPAPTRSRSSSASRPGRRCTSSSGCATPTASRSR